MGSEPLTQGSRLVLSRVRKFPGVTPWNVSEMLNVHFVYVLYAVIELIEMRLIMIRPIDNDEHFILERFRFSHLYPL